MDIHGYRVIRTLGRGGMATVYLAEQQSVQRKVALKVMSSALLGDEQFGERFLREARIAARLNHPNVVQIHDVGIDGDHHYIAMEYLPGGPVMTRGTEPRSPDFTVRVISQIAAALDYAGSRGIVHRDIKPDNILLREDGTAVLSDFGIARASDVSRMTRTGTVIGTPHYMSPEQARGQQLDGRADIYSLGVVLHELLVGHVPYRADDSVAVGIMHMTAPLPQLPTELAAFQPILDRMLAKNPAQRYQRGNEVIEALQAIGDVPASQDETRVLPITPKPLPPARTDDSGPQAPSLGRIDTLAGSPAPRSRKPASAPSGHSRYWLVASALVVVLLAGGLYRYQDTLREQLPRTHLNRLLQDADNALREGRLSGSRESARELYIAARAFDPDNSAARTGLQEVGRQLLERAHAALAEGDAVPATELLAEAESLALPSDDVAELSRALQQRQSHEDGLAAVLDAARAAERDGALDGAPDSALALYQRALTLDPGNAIARAGVREVLGQLLGEARKAMKSHRLDEARRLIDRVAQVDSAHLGLPEARAALTEAFGDNADGQVSALSDAAALLAHGQWLPPAQPNAAEVYQAVLEQDPENAEARQGLRRIATALLQDAERQIDDHAFTEAGRLIDRARGLAPALPAIAITQQRLDELRQRRGEPVGQAAVAASAIDIPHALQRARDAALAGHFLVPPGDSAYDLYRAVLAQEPDHPEARRGLDSLPDMTIRRFEEAMAANRLATAADALETLGVIAPTDARLTPARQRLARSYLAYASERIGAGELDVATRAFDQARELDPANIELPAMQARLEHARGG